MTEQELDHIRHIASLARGARRDLRLYGTEKYDLLKTLEEIENSARHAMAASLPVR